MTYNSVATIMAINIELTNNNNMKKLLLLFVIMFLTGSYVFSQELNERTYKKWLKRCDVAYCLEGQRPDYNAANFWMLLYKNEKSRKIWENNIKSKTASIAYGKHCELRPTIYSYYDPIIQNSNKYYYGWRSMYESDLLGGFKYGDLQLCRGNFAPYNAAAFPDGLIVIDESLISLLDYYELLAVLAHEYAHYILCHTYVRSYRTIKKKNRNKIASSLVVGLWAASDAYNRGYNQAYAQANGHTYNAPDEIDWGQMYEIICADLDFSTYKHSFKYTQQQELQADLVAYRLLEWKGIGGDYITKALYKLLKYTGDNYDKDWSDHPSLSFRISVLQYLYNLEHK